MGASRQSSSNQQQQKSGPWSGQSPYLLDIYSKAQDWHNQQAPLPGVGNVESDVFGRTQQNFAGSPLEQAYGDTLQSNLTGTESANPYAGAVDAAGSAANQLGGASNPYIQGVQQAGGTQNPFLGSLGQASMAQNSRIGQVAGGGGENPYLDRAFGRASDAVNKRFTEDLIPGLNATFGQAGGTGGSAHQLALNDVSGQYGNTLNNLATDIYGGAYESDAARRLQRDVSAAGFEEQGLGRQFQGAQALAGFGEAGANRGLGAATTAAGLGAQDLGRSAGIFGDDLNRRLGAAQSSAGLYNTTQDRQLGRQLGAGSQVAGLEKLQDRNVADYGAFADNGLNDLQAYNNLITPAVISSTGSGVGGSGGGGFNLK